MNEQSKITDWHPLYSQRHTQWEKVRDALEGEDKIKEQGSRYLPKPGAMSDQEYDSYKDRASFYSVAERTLRGMSGMVFRHPVKVELPTRLEPLMESATADGHSLEILAENIVNENLSIGRYGLLLDYAKELASITDAPHVVTYNGEDIINWEEQFVAGKKKLVRVVVKDDIDNTYGQDALQYLELMINEEGVYEVRKWEAQSSAKGDGNTARDYVISEIIVPKVAGKPLTEIPFVFINPYDLRPQVAKPPMVDLINVNISHYRNSADYEHAMFLTAQPTPWIAGNLDESNKPSSIGSGTIWYLPKDSQAGLLEFRGPGVEAQRTAMQDKEDRMAALGARMINEGKNRNEASDTAKMRGRGEMSLLTNVVNMAEAGLEKILRLAAEWVGANPDDVVVELNRDWIETKMDPQMLNALVKSWQSGAMSHELLYENMQAGEIAPVDRQFEEEKDAIETEGGGISTGLGTDLFAQAGMGGGDSSEEVQ